MAGPLPVPDGRRPALPEPVLYFAAHPRQLHRVLTQLLACDLDHPRAAARRAMGLLARSGFARVDRFTLYRLTDYLAVARDARVVALVGLPAGVVPRPPAPRT